MKKYFIFMSCFMLFVMISLSACNNGNTENRELKTAQQSEKSRQEDSYLPSENNETQGIVENETLDWSEITENGINEETLFQNLDIEILKIIATELQALVKEEAKEERENPEIVLSEGFLRVFKSERYLKVLEMGDSAMKPLYWIIYKSPNDGLYEYICATALTELSGFDFTNDDGTLTWISSKEFLERFNEKILAEQK